MQRIQTEISSLAFGGTHWARNFVCFFFPLDSCLCSPGLYIKGHFIETLWETIFSSSSRETPNRILPNLAHLLILCVFTSVLCGVNFQVIKSSHS
jgi:hypothetical protein